MRLSLDPTRNVPRHISAESEALAAWYDSRPDVRRLWAIRDAQTLNIILTLEPTVDNGDTYPAWFACNQGWAHEIRSITGSVVKMELLDEPQVDEFEVDIEGELVAALNWRDPSYFWTAD
jgi:hypothetical protein